MDRASLEWVELSQSMRDEVHARLPTSIAAWAVATVAEAYARDRLLAAQARRLESDPPPIRWQALEADDLWMALARAREAEERATTSARLVAWPDFNVAMLVAPPQGRRMNLVRRIDRVSHRSENVATVGKAVTLSLARAAHWLECTPSEPWPAARRRAESSVDARIAVARSRVRMGLDFAYREIELEELASWTRSLESRPGRRLHGELRRGLRETLRDTHRWLEQEFQAEARRGCATPSASSAADAPPHP